MTEYTPDKWVVVKIEGKDMPLTYKVFATWYGGFINPDTWKLNSGIKSVKKKGKFFLFEGFSGSVYKCHEKCYGCSLFGTATIHNFIEKAKEEDIMMEILNENTNWKKLKYE